MHVQTINNLSYSIDYYNLIVTKHGVIPNIDLYNIFYYNCLVKYFSLRLICV